MAFGKDPKKLNNMNLRQQLHRGTKRPPKGGGGRAAPYFVNKYEPPKTGRADIIRLVPAEVITPRVDMEAKDFVYDAHGQIVTDVMPYIKYMNYFSGSRQMGCIGSEGPLGNFKGKGDPCLANDWYWYEWRERTRTKSDKPKTLSRSEKYAFSVIVLAPFYQVPQIDSAGKPRLNPTTKEPYYDWVQGSRKRNDEFAAAGYKCKEGHRQHWSMPFGHFQMLNAYTESLARHCINCGGRDCIELQALTCQSCGEPIVELADTTLDEDEIERLSIEEVRCPNCHFTGYLEDYIRCSNCTAAAQATIFDFNLEVKRVPTADSEFANQTSLQILRAIGPEPLDSKYGEDLRKPLDLSKIFTPSSPERQLEIFGNLPDEADTTKRAPVTGASQASDYEDDDT